MLEILPGIGSTSDGGAGLASFYVEVESIESALQQVEKLGGKAVPPKTAIPGMHLKFAYLADPERGFDQRLRAGDTICLV